MNPSFTKLFKAMVNSDAWLMTDVERVLWITMVCVAERDGFVCASLPGLARVANLSIKQTSDAIKTLLNTKFFDAKIIEVNGGWSLLNYQKFRKIMDQESRRIQNAEAQTRFRNSKKA